VRLTGAFLTGAATTYGAATATTGLGASAVGIIRS